MWNIIRSEPLFYFYLPSLLIRCSVDLNTDAWSFFSPMRNMFGPFFLSALPLNRERFYQEEEVQLTWWRRWEESSVGEPQECRGTKGNDQTGPVVKSREKVVFTHKNIKSAQFWEKNNLTIAAFTEEPSMLGRRDRGPCQTQEPRVWTGLHCVGLQHHSPHRPRWRPSNFNELAKQANRRKKFLTSALMVHRAGDTVHWLILCWSTRETCTVVSLPIITLEHIWSIWPIKTILENVTVTSAGSQLEWAKM